MLSDIVHFQIARVDVDMLGAGRLGFRPDQYRAAMQDYRMRFAAAQATRAAERFRISNGKGLGRPMRNGAKTLKLKRKPSFAFPSRSWSNCFRLQSRRVYETHPSYG